MVGLLLLALALGLFNKDALLCKRVVLLPEELAVADRQPPHLRVELAGEVLEGAQLMAEIDAVSIQQHAKDGLRGTCVLHDLSGEEETVIVLF